MRGDDDSHDKEGEDGAAGAGSDQEERLNKLVVSGGHSSVRIRWDGEPELPI